MARTRGRLWSTPHPARIVLIAVIGTQILATLIAASGLLMKPLDWDLIALAWGYALIWILFLDQLKLWAYRGLERHRELASPILAVVAKALAEPLRVRILDVLRRSEQEVCQCELIALFEIGQSLLSHHMRKLADAGLVRVERRHKWAYYSVNTDAFKELTSWLS